MRRSFFAGPYVLWMILFTVVPLFFVLQYAFTKDGGITPDNFIKFADPMYIHVLFRSLWMALLCTVICLLLGYPAAYFLASKGFSEKRWLLLLFIMPMWMNFLIRTYAWMTLLEDNGLINQFLGLFGAPKISFLYNEGAVLTGLVYNYLPFMILPIHTSLTKMDRGLIEAAEDLGANRKQVFSRVTFPLSIPGIVSGITMVFMPSVTTFAISRLLGGGQAMMFGDLIEQQFLSSGNWNFGSALSIIMMILIVGAMLILNHFESAQSGSAEEGGRW